MSDDIERKVFEKAMQGRAELYWLNHADQYGSLITQKMWETWQAARAQAKPYSGVPDLTSTIVNDCCWTFVDAMPYTLPAPIFNNLKPALYEALKQYHNALLTASTPQPAPSAVPEGYVAIGESNLGARREYGETADEASEKMERTGFYTYEIKELYASQPAEQGHG